MLDTVETQAHLGIAMIRRLQHTFRSQRPEGLGLWSIRMSVSLRETTANPAKYDSEAAM